MKKFIRVFFVFLSFILASFAQAADTPTTLAGVKTVSTAEAKSLHEKGVVFVDTRVVNEYAEGHIANAPSIPYKEKSLKSADFDESQDSFDIEKKISDKNTPIVMYCNGPSCWKSFKAAKVALKKGYKVIYYYRDGFPAWKQAGNKVE